MRPSDADIIAALYDGVVADEALQRALTLLAERFDCPSIALVSFDAATPQADMFAAAGAIATPEFLRSYREEWSAHDPAPRVLAAQPPLAVTTSTALFDADFLNRNVFYNEFFRAIGLEETLGGNLSSRNGHFALIGLQRGKDRRAFDEGEMRALEAFTPHLGRALQLRRAFAERSTKLKALADAFDRLAMGVIIAGREGGEIHVNRAAREIAARRDGLSLDRKGALHCAHGEAERRLLQLCADVRGGGAGGFVRVTRRGRALPYVVLIAPLPASGAIDHGRADAGCVLTLVHDPSARIANPVETIAAMFGLSPGAARLLAALAEGEDAKAYAERHGVTVDAIKFHLKTAFAKSGLRTQARLLQEVARAVTELGRRRSG